MADVPDSVSSAAPLNSQGRPHRLHQTLFDPEGTEGDILHIQAFTIAHSQLGQHTATWGEEAQLTNTESTSNIIINSFTEDILQLTREGAVAYHSFPSQLSALPR